MKWFVKVLVIFSAVCFTSLAFAAKDPTMNIQFINNTTDTGNADLLSFNSNVNGPIVERNGGSANFSALVPNQLFLLSLTLKTGWGFFCLQNNHNVILNPQNYTGDTIVVTFAGINSQGMQCTCTGSACDVGASAKKTI